MSNVDLGMSLPPSFDVLVVIVIVIVILGMFNVKILHGDSDSVDTMTRRRRCSSRTLHRYTNQVWSRLAAVDDAVALF